MVRMVRAITGPDAFQKGLQTYFAKYEYGNATTKDLWDEWSAASGKDINKMMSTWTLVKGYPYVKVVKEEWADNRVTITLEQAWFLQDGSGDTDPEAPIWDILCSSLPKAVSTDVAQVMSEKAQTYRSTGRCG